MDLVTASEARQWRRCSLAAVVVLVLSLAGEQVVAAIASDEPPPHRPSVFSSPYVPHTTLFRILGHFADVRAR
jgi:hypothetical protein